MDFLKKLGIDKENFGASIGPGHWSETKDAGQSIPSIQVQRNLLGLYINVIRMIMPK